MPTKPLKAAPLSRLIGYARVSTEEQGTDPQLDELRAAGCVTVLEEHASGADRSRPMLARLLHEIRPSETLVVVRLDRLDRSVSTSSPSSNSSRPRACISVACATRLTPPTPQQIPAFAQATAATPPPEQGAS
jgi:DNA invertase Pin-like site-specific DNA recombinase